MPAVLLVSSQRWRTLEMELKVKKGRKSNYKKQKGFNERVAYFCAPTIPPMFRSLFTVITIYTCSTLKTDLKQKASIVSGDNWQTSSCGLFPHSFRTNRADTTGVLCFWGLMSIMTSEAFLPGSAMWLVEILAWGFNSNMNPIGVDQRSSLCCSCVLVFSVESLGSF